MRKRVVFEESFNRMAVDLSEAKDAVCLQRQNPGLMRGVSLNGKQVSTTLIVGKKVEGFEAKQNGSGS